MEKNKWFDVISKDIIKTKLLHFQQRILFSKWGSSSPISGILAALLLNDFEGGKFLALLDTQTLR